MSFADQIRPMGPADINFIKASWKEEARRQEEYEARRLAWIPNEVFNLGLERRISRLLQRCVCLVACPAGVEDDWLAGYIVVEEEAEALHMAYTKPRAFRRKGVATALLASAPPVRWYTQRTAAMRHLEEKWGVRYNPFILEE